MPPFPSDAWFDSADRALTTDTELARHGQGIHLVLQQTVTGDHGSATWHISIDDGTVSLFRGPASDPDVTFACDGETAEGIHDGAVSAQAAFMAGRLRVGGDVGALLQHPELLRALSETLGPLGSVTG